MINPYSATVYHLNWEKENILGKLISLKPLYFLNQKYNSILETMFIYSQDLDHEKKTPVRAGVIPFTVRDHRLHFLLGIDRRTRELTDFGGGVKNTETMLDAAFRELLEESCKIFGGSVTKEHLKESPAVANSSRTAAIFFLRVDSKWIDNAEIEFNTKQQELCGIKKHNELIGVKWVDQENFKLIAFNRRSQCMWKRIQNILCWNTTWSELRLTLMLGPELTNAIKNSWNYYKSGITSQYTQGITVPQDC
jgi:hypothetical protein